MDLAYREHDKAGSFLAAAGAALERLSQLILDEGKQFCTLYTDLANPTSNRIYQQIGYRPVADVVDIRFEAGPGA